MMIGDTIAIDWYQDKMSGLIKNIETGGPFKFARVTFIDKSETVLHLEELNSIRMILTERI